MEVRSYADDTQETSHAISVCRSSRDGGINAEDEGAGAGSEGLRDNSGEEVRTTRGLESLDSESGAGGAGHNESDETDRNYDATHGNDGEGGPDCSLVYYEGCDGAASFKADIGDKDGSVALVDDIVWDCDVHRGRLVLFWRPS